MTRKFKREETNPLHQERTSFSAIKQTGAFIAVCCKCERTYVIGRTGTVEGCDECLHITRNQRDGTIINDNIFRTYADDEDMLTDMEKA